MIDLSRQDRLLLDELQKDASRSQSELAAAIGLSRAACWRRLQEFDSAELVERRVALLNPRKAGFEILVLLEVSMTEHSDENRQAFESHVDRLENVTECYAVAGERDYVLHVVARDIDAYTEFLNQEILKHPAVRSASSTFSLKRIKYSTRLPMA